MFVDDLFVDACFYRMSTLVGAGSSYCHIIIIFFFRPWATVKRGCTCVRHRIGIGSCPPTDTNATDSNLVCTRISGANCYRPCALASRKPSRTCAACLARRRSDRAAPPACGPLGRWGSVRGAGPAERRTRRDAARVHAGDGGVLGARGVLAPRRPRAALRSSRKPERRSWCCEQCAPRVPTGARSSRLRAAHGAPVLHVRARGHLTLHALAIRQQQQARFDRQYFVMSTTVYTLHRTATWTTVCVIYDIYCTVQYNNYSPFLVSVQNTTWWMRQRFCQCSHSASRVATACSTCAPGPAPVRSPSYRPFYQVNATQLRWTFEAYAVLRN